MMHHQWWSPPPQKTKSERLQLIETKRAQALTLEGEMKDLKGVRYEMERAAHTYALQLNQATVDYLDCQAHLEETNQRIRKLEADHRQLDEDISSEVDKVSWGPCVSKGITAAAVPQAIFPLPHCITLSHDK